MKNEKLRIRKGGMLSDFGLGFLAGVLFAGIIFSVVAGFWYSRNREREIVNHVLEYAEKQIEIEALREDYQQRDAVEFLDDIPGVRGAADRAAAEFDRKRDEALQRFRNRIADR